MIERLRRNSSTDRQPVGPRVAGSPVTSAVVGRVAADGLLAEYARQNIPEFIKAVKRGERRLLGFGHRVYKSYDPRATIIKYWADRVFEVTGHNPLIDIALELERIALDDEYFTSRKLYPNVDFYSGIIYEAMGFPAGIFSVLFAIPRTAGWLAQWRENIEDPEQKIARPRQVYLGAARRDYLPVEQRVPAPRPAARP